jgi:hypothetical protein
MKKASANYWLLRVLALMFSISVAFAQENLPPPNQPPPPTFSQQELDQMLAPIALYPDSLLSQILMASTYPLEVVEAACWSQANPGLQGDPAVQAVETTDWDPSVKSLVAFPQLLAMMNQNLNWTDRLGDAFLAQQPQIMDTVQNLRERAYVAGNLRSTDQLRVEQEGQSIVVEPVSPEMIYVPYYDPTIIYGTWWWPAPPFYWWPFPGYHVRPSYPGFSWGIGITVSSGFFFGAFDWHRRSVNVVRVNNYYYRPENVSHAPPNVVPGAWQHDPFHRRGTVYRDATLRQRFGRAGSGVPAARSNFRGRDAMPSPTVNRNTAFDTNRPGNAPFPASGTVSRPENRADNNPANNRPNVGAPSPNIAPHARVDINRQPASPTRVVAPVNRPAPIAREPHVFEGIGPGANARNESTRGHSSFKAIENSRNVAPAARQPAASRPSPAGGGANRQQGGGDRGHGGGEKKER